MCLILCRCVPDMVTSPFFSGFYLTWEYPLSTVLFPHAACPTWELPTVITVCSCAAMCSSSTTVAASFTSFRRQTQRECYCSSFNKKRSRELNWQPSTPNQYLQAVKALFNIKLMPCLQSSAMGMISQQTLLNNVYCQTQLTLLSWDLAVSLCCVDAMRTHLSTSVLAVSRTTRTRQ